jgi:mycobactin peptide synthetase MbtE
LAAAVDALEASGDGASPDNGDDASESRFEPMTTSGLSASDLAAVSQLWSKSRDGTS